MITFGAYFLMGSSILLMGIAIGSQRENTKCQKKLGMSHKEWQDLWDEEDFTERYQKLNK